MLALVIDVPAAEVELASDAQWALGVVAVEERVGVAGRVELWTSLGDDRALVLDAVAGFSERWTARLVEVANAALRQPELVARAATAGFLLRGGDEAQARAHVAAEAAKWGRVIRERAITFEG